MEMTDELSRKFLVKEGYGLLISRVNEASAAQKSRPARRRHHGPGQRPRHARTAFDLRHAIKCLKEKEAVQLELYRDGQLRKFIARSR